MLRAQCSLSLDLLALSRCFLFNNLLSLCCSSCGLCCLLLLCLNGDSQHGTDHVVWAPTHLGLLCSTRGPLCCPLKEFLLFLLLLWFLLFASDLAVDPVESHTDPDWDHSVEKAADHFDYCCCLTSICFNCL